MDIPSVIELVFLFHICKIIIIWIPLCMISTPITLLIKSCKTSYLSKVSSTRQRDQGCSPNGFKRMLRTKPITILFYGTPSLHLFPVRIITSHITKMTLFSWTWCSLKQRIQLWMLTSWPSILSTTEKTKRLECYLYHQMTENKKDKDMKPLKISGVINTITLFSQIQLSPILWWSKV